MTGHKILLKIWIILCTLADAQKKVQHLNRIVAEGRNDRRARKEAEDTVKELQEERESARFKSEQALEAARAANALVIREAQLYIEKAENANAQIILEAQQQVERAVSASLCSSGRERELIEQKMDELLDEVRSMKHQKEEAIQDAAQAPEEDTQARQETAQPQREATPARGEAAEAKAQAQAPARGPTSQRSAQARSTAVKWVRAEHEGGPLLAHEQARDVLEGVCSNQAVNVVMIFGAARQGKSFLMNAMTGFDDLFRVSPESHPCTAGADLSPILMALPDFERGGGAPFHPSSGSAHPTIAFVDMEGLGDKSGEHHVRLATPFLIVSKVRKFWIQSVAVNRAVLPCSQPDWFSALRTL